MHSVHAAGFKGTASDGRINGRGKGRKRWERERMEWVKWRGEGWRIEVWKKWRGKDEEIDVMHSVHQQFCVCYSSAS